MGRDWPAKAQGQQDLLRYTLRAHCMEQCELARGWKKTVDGGFEAKRRDESDSQTCRDLIKILKAISSTSAG
jgi:hypothetical protein